MQTVLVTGSAGFIGFHLTQQLHDLGYKVIGIDNLNDYYSVQLKEDRNAILHQLPNYQFIQGGIEDTALINELFEQYPIDYVVNLAAQAGVRYSLENPHAYAQSNVIGFLNILEAAKTYKVKHLVYASSSSVYGANQNMPFSEHHPVNHPVSMYAATKKANELMAHSYSHLYNLPTTGLRFFTVYGPWGRPDMSPMLFASAIVENRPINVFNHGQMQRDFTYIDDIVTGIIGTMQNPPVENPEWDRVEADPATSYAPYRVYNIGNNEPVALMDFIQTIEKHVGKEAVKNMMPMQAGDVQATYANIDDLQALTDFKPTTSIDAGIEKFVTWYKDYYKVGE
ncbi:MAG: NAD-dependent epimerase [Culicoidibacterales bacterium]